MTTILTVSCSAFAEAQTTTTTTQTPTVAPTAPVTSTTAPTTTTTQQTTVVDPQRLQMAKVGCQKPIGFFPTPSKLMCLLVAMGKTEKDIKPKAMAVVFSGCQGRLTQPQPAGVTPKRYPTLGACLSDPMAVEAINKELAAQGFNPVTIVNPNVLVPAAQ